MATNPKNTFAGKGMAKASRRSHAQAQGRRKYYPRLRPDQRGTPVETYYKTHYSDLDKQGNDHLDKYGKFTERISTKKDLEIGSMQHPESYGKLNKEWSSLYSNHHGPAYRSFIINDHMRTSRAKSAAKDLFMISFGADPKSR